MIKLSSLIKESSKYIDPNDDSNILNQISTQMSEEGIYGEEARLFLQEIINYCQQEINGLKPKRSGKKKPSFTDRDAIYMEPGKTGGDSHFTSGWQK